MRQVPSGDALHPQQVPDGMPVGGVGNLMNKYQLDMVCRVAFWILVQIPHSWGSEGSGLL